MPDCRIASTLKAHHTELPTPTSHGGQQERAGPRAEEPRDAQLWQPRTAVIGGRCMEHGQGAHHYGDQATKTPHATRHCAPATIAIGPAMATPHPVPELIVDHTHVPLLLDDLARDDVGVRRERHAGCGTGDDHPDGDERHRLRTCDDAHPDSGEECGSSDGHARSPPSETATTPMLAAM